MVTHIFNKQIRQEPGCATTGVMLGAVRLSVTPHQPPHSCLEAKPHCTSSFVLPVASAVASTRQCILQKKRPRIVFSCHGERFGFLRVCARFGYLEIVQERGKGSPQCRRARTLTVAAATRLLLGGPVVQTILVHRLRDGEPKINDRLCHRSNTCCFYFVLR